MSRCIEHRQKGGTLGHGATHYNGVRVGLHRLAYCFARQIPLEYIEGTTVRHTCDNGRCINPQHLVVGTQADNIQDMVDRNRQAKGGVQHLAVLTANDVLYIREHYVARSKTNNATVLAKRFGVVKQTITKVLTGETWSHI